MFEIKCVKKEMYYRRQAWVLKKMCSFVVDSKAYKSVSTQNSGEKSILLAIKLQKEVRYQRNYITWTSL